jgi:dipeptidyl aminopeptidase/acylaminoacyl peptidase
MTAQPVRHTKFASWFDPDAWMEAMKGHKWETLLREEAANVHQITNQMPVKRRLSKFRISYATANGGESTHTFKCGPANVSWMNSFFKEWSVAGSSVKHEARDLSCLDSTLFATQDIGEGAERFQLQCWKDGCAAKPSWTKQPVGPDVAAQSGKVYYLGVKNKLIYHTLYSCDADTGKNERVVYEETNPMVNLALEKHPDGRLLLICDNSQDIDVYEVKANGTLTKTERFPPSSQAILPIGEYGTCFAWPRKGLLITKRHGTRTLWKVYPTRSVKKILSIPAGEMTVDPYTAWLGQTPCIIRVDQPDKGVGLYHFDDSDVVLQIPIHPTGLETHRFSTKSFDGTEVHGIYTFQTGTKPTKALVIGYGAYGMPTSVGSVAHRWAPLVSNGWAIVHTFLRGGGDHTEAWAKEGRRAGRKKTIEDFISLIYSAQAKLKISAKKTAIYGRSAGGLLVGGTLGKYSEGSLMSAVYTEVPYVDELRTTTNPDLPLTSLETNEFGAPAMRLDDFISVGRLSPADTAAGKAAPNVFVWARTAEHDSQVFAYEPVKWVRRLRAVGGVQAKGPKIVLVEKGQGHFTPPDATVQQWSLDCAVLDSWMEGQLEVP